jgi:uncharacterized membrane protein
MRQADFFAAQPKAAGGGDCGASASPLSPEQRRRFRIACRMLRQAGRLDKELAQQKRGESPIDWLCRLGLASSPAIAAEMLIVGAGLHPLLDQLCQLPEEELPL